MTTVKRRLFGTLKKKFDSYIASPGLSEQEYLTKQVTFYWSVFMCTGTIVLTVIAILMKADIIAQYGYVLLVLYATGFILYGTRSNFKIYTYIHLYLAILVSEIYVVNHSTKKNW